MEEKRPRTSLAGLFIAMTAACAVLAFWAASPGHGEWNLIVTATAIALVFGLLTSEGMRFGMLFGAYFIVLGVPTILERDLSTPRIIILIHLTVAAVPMAAAAWLGRTLRDRLSVRR